MSGQGGGDFPHRADPRVGRGQDLGCGGVEPPGDPVRGTLGVVGDFHDLDECLADRGDVRPVAPCSTRATCLSMSSPFHRTSWL
ncbi:hypothetical protein [Streptomyces sirii]|uniref:hypothetical protein n=1 Tax=Streptomyces sirii TaxID=3127701 RepID=UPI003D3677F1